MCSRQIFVRDALQLLVGDSFQRALILHSEVSNCSTLKPCPNCWVTQTGEDGGDVDDPFSEGYLNRRPWTQAEGYFEKLHQLPSGSEVAAKMSTGVNAPDRDLPSPMYEGIAVEEPTRIATAEIHCMDGQVYS